MDFNSKKQNIDLNFPVIYDENERDYSIDLNIHQHHTEEEEIMSRTEGEETMSRLLEPLRTSAMRFDLNLEPDEDFEPSLPDTDLHGVHVEDEQLYGVHVEDEQLLSEPTGIFFFQFHLYCSHTTNCR